MGFCHFYYFMVILNITIHSFLVLFQFPVSNFSASTITYFI